MVLPANFGEWEHLKDQVRLQHNKNVQNFFKNTKNDTVGTPKESLKHACLMKDSDTADMVLLRKLLFEFDAGHAQSLQAPIYGIPVDVHQSNTAFKPQVHIHFQEKYPYIADRLRPCRGQISFVLMDETSENYSRAKAEKLAAAIKREIATPVLIWEKGKFYYYYRDKDRGYDLRLLVKSKTEGERITKAVLGIQSHPFNDDFSDYVSNERTYSNTPGTHRIYGQTQPKPIKRPTVDVRFRYAQLLLHGRRKAINLVSTPGVALKEVIERVAVA